MRPAAAPSPSAQAGVTGLSVLIADDSAVTRRVMAALVSTILEDFAVVEAANAAETAEVLRQGKFDVAFVDAHLPGLASSGALPLSRDGGRPPCLILMSDGPGHTREEFARSVEAYECLQKPLEEDELRLIFKNVQRMRQSSRILVVDDSKSARRLMEKVLGRSRFAMDIEALRSGEEALAALKRQSADVVFLDYDMPGIDGLETACLIQEMLPGARVVMVSASHNRAVERAARYFGAIDFIRKPFYARDVDKAMHVALELPLTSLLVDPEPEGEAEKPAEDTPDRPDLIMPPRLSAILQA